MDESGSPNGQSLDMGPSIPRMDPHILSLATPRAMTPNSPTDSSMPQPAQESGDDRRRWQRARAEWPITVQLADGPHEARIRDVSQAGVCFFLDRPLPEMTMLSIQFELPVEGGRRRVRGSGAVVRCEKISAAIDHYEIAVYLQDMAEPDRATIASYVGEPTDSPDSTAG
ncbi:MAG: hypothetical protein ACI8QZ_000335 [Chlamydiales bacterium]|jgi:hypothetical protein